MKYYDETRHELRVTLTGGELIQDAYLDVRPENCHAVEKYIKEMSQAAKARQKPDNL